LSKKGGIIPCLFKTSTKGGIIACPCMTFNYGDMKIINQTNMLSYQQRQNSTVNIFNIQLYTFIITFGKHKFIQKIKKWRQEYKNTKYDHDKLYDCKLHAWHENYSSKPR
jgi:hypothetical protein